MAGLRGHDQRPLAFGMWAVLTAAAWPGVHARLPDRPWLAHLVALLGPPCVFAVLAAIVAAGSWLLGRKREP